MSSNCGKSTRYIRANPSVQIMLGVCNDTQGATLEQIFSVLSKSSYISGNLKLINQVRGRLNKLQYEGFFKKNQYKICKKNRVHEYWLTESAQLTLNDHPEWIKYYHDFLTNPDILTAV